MKVLLDENLPHELRHHLVGHDVFTVAYVGWSGTKNGALLQRAAADGFGAFVTMDNGVAYQQNVASLPLGVVILSAASNDVSDLLPLVPGLLRCLATMASGTIARVP
jgi:hypothetical protein